MAGSGFVDGGGGWSTKGGKGSQGKGYDSTCLAWSQEWNCWVQTAKGKGKGKENNKGKGKGKQAGGGGKAGGGKDGPKPAVVQCLNPDCDKCGNGYGVLVSKWIQAHEGGATGDSALACKFCHVQFVQGQPSLREYLKGKENPKTVSPGAKAKGTTNLGLPPIPEEVKKIFDEEDIHHLHSRMKKLPGVETGVTEGWQELRDKVMAGTTKEPSVLALLDFMLPVPGVVKPREEINQAGKYVRDLRIKKAHAEGEVASWKSKLAKAAIAITEASERYKECESGVGSAEIALGMVMSSLELATIQQDAVLAKADADAKKATWNSPATESQVDEDMEHPEDDELRVTVTAQVVKAAEEQFIEWKIRAHAEFVQQIAIEREKFKTEKPTEVTMGAYVSPAFTLNKEKVNAAAKESQKALKAARKASAAGGVTKKPKVIGAGTPAQAAKQAFDDAEASKAALEADAAAALEMNSEL